MATNDSSIADFKCANEKDADIIGRKSKPNRQRKPAANTTTNRTTATSNTDDDKMASRRLQTTPSLLNTNDIDKLYHHFLRLDADNNGVIDRQEFLSHPAIAENPLATRIMAMFDTDRGGTIDFAEFVHGLARFSGKAGGKEARMRFAFDVYDEDGDGFISNGELFRTLRAMSGTQMKEEHLQQVVDRTIRDLDKDGDGRIGFDEWVDGVGRRNGQLFDRLAIADL